MYYRAVSSRLEEFRRDLEPHRGVRNQLPNTTREQTWTRDEFFHASTGSRTYFDTALSSREAMLACSVARARSQDLRSALRHHGSVRRNRPPSVPQQSRQAVRQKKKPGCAGFFSALPIDY